MAEITDDDVEVLSGPGAGGGTAFQRGFSQPVAKGVADFLQREFGTNPLKISDPRKALPPGMTPGAGEASLQPGGMAQGVANTVTPQSPTGLAIDIGAMATGGLSIPMKYATMAGAGALGGAFEPQPAPVMGAAKSVGAQAGGDILSKAAGWVGRKVGEQRYLEKMSDKIGDFLEGHLPWLKGQLNSAGDLFRNFSTSKATDEANATLERVKANIAQRMQIKAPNGVSDRLFWSPDVDTVSGKVTWNKLPFTEADQRITALNSMGRQIGAGDPRGGVDGAVYRRVSHEARIRLMDELRGLNPKLADAYQASLRRFSIASKLNELFRTENGVFLENGELNLPKLKDYVQRVYSRNFHEAMGPEDLNNFVQVLGGGEYTPAIGKLGESGHARWHGIMPSVGMPKAMKMPGKLPVYMNPPAAPVTMGISRVLNPGGGEEE